ncbi:hypothetical protein OAM56_01845 [Alphaproteobacteria bacterium]|nr:hypothetical protein [Alphaproteobacteria bacterium]
MINIKSKINDNLLMSIINIDSLSNKNNFISSEQDPLQIGFFNFEKSYKVQTHKHVDNIKKTTKTNEAWFIIDGIFEVESLDFNQETIYKKQFTKNNLIIYYAGYHSIKAISKMNKLLEFRNGPYLGRENETVKL